MEQLQKKNVQIDARSQRTKMKSDDKYKLEWRDIEGTVHSWDMANGNSNNNNNYAHLSYFANLRQQEQQQQQPSQYSSEMEIVDDSSVFFPPPRLVSISIAVRMASDFYRNQSSRHAIIPSDGIIRFVVCVCVLWNSRAIVDYTNRQHAKDTHVSPNNINVKSEQKSSRTFRIVWSSLFLCVAVVCLFAVA